MNLFQEDLFGFDLIIPEPDCRKRLAGNVKHPPRAIPTTTKQTSPPVRAFSFFLWPQIEGREFLQACLAGYAHHLMEKDQAAIVAILSLETL